MIRLAENLSLPVDVATQTMLIVGKRGSGKTSTAVRLAEQLHHAGVPFAVVDPVDVWWGLKAARDGKSAGLSVYVFGGRHADLPLEAALLESNDTAARLRKELEDTKKLLNATLDVRDRQSKRIHELCEQARP